MSVLDSFYILFKGDNADLVKSTKEAGKALDDFQTGQKKVDEQTRQLGVSFTDLAAAGVAAFASIFAVGKIKDGILNTASLNAEIRRTSLLTGVGAADIAGWGYALQTVGGTAEEFRGNLLALNDAYAKAGLDFNINALLKLADTFKALHDAGQRAQEIRLAQNLGIDDNFVLLLEKGSANVKSIVDHFKEVSGVTDESTAKALAFEARLTGISAAGHKIYTELQPALGNIIDLFNILIDGVENFIKGLNILGRGINDLARGDYGAAWKEWFGPGGSSTQKQNPAGTTTGSNNARALSLISHYESGDRNVPNQMGPGGTAASTASGYYQITNGTWRDFAPKAGVDLNQYPTAISAPYDVQSKVASAIYDQRGLEPWNSDTKLLAAAQGAINTADSSSLNSPTVGNDTHNNVQIGNITINTQATDANGIATDLYSKLNQNQYKLTQQNFDDGQLK